MFKQSWPLCAFRNEPMKPRRIFWLASFVLFSVLKNCTLAIGDEPTSPLSFVRDIAPLLQSHCIACHRSGKSDGGLAVDTFSGLTATADSGVALVPGKSAESSFYTRLLEQDESVRMPQKAAPMTAEQIALIKRWIDEGANSDAEAGYVIQPSKSPLPIVATVKQHLTVSLPIVSPPLDCQVTYGPTAPIVALAFSPDGKQLAVGGYQQVQLWDLNAGNLTQIFSGHCGAVDSLCFSHDGAHLVAGGGIPGEIGEIKIWDIATGQAKCNLTPHKDSVYALALSRDGKWMASGGADSVVNIFDLVQAKQVHSIKEHAGWIYGLAFTADNQFLATACGDKTTRIFKVGEDWARQGKFEHTEPVWNVAFNSDGGQVAAAVGGPSDKSVKVHNRADGAVARTLGAHTANVLDVVWSEDGKWIATACEDKAGRIFDATNGALKFTLSGHAGAVYTTVLSPDGKRVATGDAEGIVRLWDAADGKLIATLAATNSTSTEWMMLTSNAYYTSSGQPGLQWHRAGQLIPSDQAQALLNKPEFVQNSLRAEVVAAPVLP